MKKNLIICFIAIVAVLVIILAVLLLHNFLGAILLGTNPLKESSITNDYTENKFVFNNSAGLISQYSNNISIDSNSKHNGYYILTILDTHSIIKKDDIKDTAFADYLTRIFVDFKYDSIEKNTNGIFFTRKSGLSFEQGLAYSLDGQKPKSTDMDVTFLDHISGNWYYYRAN